MEGNVKGLQKLFRAGLASPFNTDYSGFTTLHYAVGRGRIEAAQFLLQCGVDISAKSGPDSDLPLMFNKDCPGTCTALQMFSWLGAHLIYHKSINVSDHQDMLRLLVSSGEGGLADIDGGGRNPLQMYIGPTSTYSWFLAQGEAELRYDTLTEPLWLRKFEIFFTDPIALLRETLPNRQVTESVAMQRTADGYTILHYALHRWSHISTRRDVFPDYPRLFDNENSREFEGWEQIIRDILRAGGDIHAMSRSGKTPFLVLLSNVHRVYWKYNWNNPLHRCRRSLKKILAAWLRILREEGFDLQTYKEREIQLWDAELLKSWGGISRVEFMPHEWVDIHWQTPEHPRNEQHELDRSFDYFSRLTGDKDVNIAPPEDDADWYMVGGSYMAERKDDEGDGVQKIPGSWV